MCSYRHFERLVLLHVVRYVCCRCRYFRFAPCGVGDLEVFFSIVCTHDAVCILYCPASSTVYCLQGSALALVLLPVIKRACLLAVNLSPPKRAGPNHSRLHPANYHILFCVSCQPLNITAIGIFSILAQIVDTDCISTNSYDVLSSQRLSSLHAAHTPCLYPTFPSASCSCASYFCLSLSLP